MLQFLDPYWQSKLALLEFKISNHRSLLPHAFGTFLEFQKLEFQKFQITDPYCHTLLALF